MGKRFFCPFFCRASSTVLLLTAVSCGGDRRPIPPKQAHDLIVITIDTLRADRVAGDGAAPTPAPTLQAIGRDGAMFLDASAHVPLTLPSHASIFTGRYPPAHGVHDNSGFVVPESLPTLASTLRGAGYHTAAFVSSFVLLATTGLANGFEVYDDRVAGVGRSRPTTAQLERRGPEVAQEALGWLSTAPRPFFLWVHFYDPHAPYDPPPAFAARFPGHPYDGEVATSDFGVSMILNALPQRRRADVIVATGDHGESLARMASRSTASCCMTRRCTCRWSCAAPGSHPGDRARAGSPRRSPAHDPRPARRCAVVAARRRQPRAAAVGIAS